MYVYFKIAHMHAIPNPRKNTHIYVLCKYKISIPDVDGSKRGCFTGFRLCTCMHDIYILCKYKISVPDVDDSKRGCCL
jgi:hypothetical protein